MGLGVGAVKTCNRYVLCFSIYLILRFSIRLMHDIDRFINRIKYTESDLGYDVAYSAY